MLRRHCLYRNHQSYFLCTFIFYAQLQFAMSVQLFLNRKKSLHLSNRRNLFLICKMSRTSSIAKVASLRNYFIFIQRERGGKTLDDTRKRERDNIENAIE
jgi:ribosomal 30S subunit maturation factor RimM